MTLFVNTKTGDLYHDGHIFITSGCDHVGVIFKLMKGGTGVQQTLSHAVGFWKSLIETFG
jgi:hypothetical protein